MFKLLLRSVCLCVSVSGAIALDMAPADGPPEEPPAVSLPSNLQDGESLPSGSEVNEALREILDEERNREERLKEPQQVQSRETSRLA